MNAVLLVQRNRGGRQKFLGRRPGQAGTLGSGRKMLRHRWPEKPTLPREKETSNPLKPLPKHECSLCMAFSTIERLRWIHLDFTDFLVIFLKELAGSYPPLPVVLLGVDTQGLGCYARPKKDSLRKVIGLPFVLYQELDTNLCAQQSPLDEKRGVSAHK